MTIEIRISMLLIGLILYQVVQWNYAFDGNIWVESIGILLILLALVPK